MVQNIVMLGDPFLFGFNIIRFLEVKYKFLALPEKGLV